MGAVIVLVMTNGLIRLGYGTGTNQMVLGLMLAAAVTLDIRWLKNRHKVLNEVYVAPIYHRMGETQSALPGSGTPYALNDRLSRRRGDRARRARRARGRHARPRRPSLLRHAPWRDRPVPRARLQALGGLRPYRRLPARASPSTATAISSPASAPWGSIRSPRTARCTKLSAETRRSLTSVVDDARLRDPNDLDVAPDGRIFFTDSTTRYDAHDWALDSIESRPTGRLLCYDPRSGKTKTLLDNYRYANGVCIAHDGKSLFFAESWACRVHRYWFDGPKAGTVECVISDMPGYPDNINRASDGSYWMAWLGMRTPSFDLGLRHPGMRKRMTRRLPQDDWLFPNINTGGVVKFDGGRPHRRDARRSDRRCSHPMVTSMREHKGYLYVGGILNNRIGRYSIPGADPTWTGAGSYWGVEREELSDPRSAPRSLPRQGGHHPAHGRRAEAEHGARRGARSCAQRQRRTLSAATATAMLYSAGTEVLAALARRRRAVARFDAPVAALAVSPGGQAGRRRWTDGPPPDGERTLPAPVAFACADRAGLRRRRHALRLQRLRAPSVRRLGARSDGAQGAAGSVWRVDLA